jgi:hypothetical protein
MKVRWVAQNEKKNNFKKWMFVHLRQLTVEFKIPIFVIRNLTPICDQKMFGRRSAAADIS